MGFVLKIYLFGLIALAPSDDGRELTALLLDLRSGTESTAGRAIAPHQPMIIARAGECSGDCWHESDAQLILQRTGEVEPRLEELRKAIQGGGVWLLDGEELGLDLGKRAEDLTIDLERDDDSWWVPHMGLIAPRAARPDASLLEAADPGSRIVGRLRLRHGEVMPYRFVVYDGEIVSLTFGSDNAEGGGAIEPQPFADWIKVEIPIEACEVTLAAAGFDGKTSRRMTLAPKGCDGQSAVEVALLNIPAEGGPLPSRQRAEAEAEPIGHHFDLYYDLAAEPLSQRPLPTVAPRQDDYRLPSHASDSLLLAALRMSDWRGSYHLPICPMALFGEP